MSSTRRSTDGSFRQERFCSAPEFEGDTIKGLAAAKRISIVKDRLIRELLWWIQWRSLQPAGLQTLCEELIAEFQNRLGPPALNLFRISKRHPTKADAEKISESLDQSYWHWRRETAAFSVDDLIDDIVGDDDFESRTLTPSESVESWKKQAAAAASESLASHLISCCLDPGSDISRSPWYFDDPISSLKAFRDSSVKAARSRLADTAITRQINDAMDFWKARRRMILIEGVAGIGRTATARAWCDAHCGLARYVEVPSSSDDRSFFASIARALGVAGGTSYKSQEIKVRVEEMLATSELMLVFDESQYLWFQYLRPRKTPDRLLWIKTIFDAGTPIALIAHTDFSKWQAHYVKQMLWADDQFERRLNRRVVLPLEHSRTDMLKIAQAHLPGGDERSWKLLASYALGTEKKQASGIVEALESARYRAEKAGRETVIFADIEAALIHDHQFLNPASAPDLHNAGTGVAEATKPSRNGASDRARRRSRSDFPIRGRLSGGRITIPIAT